MRMAAIVALIVLAAGNATAAPVICGIDQRYECARDGCTQIMPDGSYNRLDPERQTFSRCDGKGCEDYPATFTPSGIFTNIDFAYGAFAKLSETRGDETMPERLQRLHLVEVVTLGIAVVVSYGTCSEPE